MVSPPPAYAPGFVVGVSLLPARTAWYAAWPRLQARGEAAFDDAPAGPLTEHFARSIGEHRVIERAPTS